MSVADRGRGGFDSHTFPPFFSPVLGLALGLALMTHGPRAASAQVPAAPVPATAKAPPRATADTTRGERLRPWHEQPWSIMARSALVPGWGQLKNGRPLKAGLAVAIEGVAGVRLALAWRDVNDAAQREDQAQRLGDQDGADAARADYDRAYNRRAAAGWILGIAVVLSMVDAYVDAHLIQFDADFGPDPALPDDTSGAMVPGTPGPRLSLRYSF